MLDLFLKSAFFAQAVGGGSLAQAIGKGLGIVLGIGFLAAVASLVAAALGGFGERSISGIKISLVLAIICGLSYLIVNAVFVAGGVPQNVVAAPIN
jgi:hypothetical protein